MYTNFGLILSIRSQDIEQKPNFDGNQGPLLCCKFVKNNDLQITTYILSMIMCIQNFVLIGLFVFKILSKNLILTSIKGRNSVANIPKFEVVQTFMHVFSIPARMKKIQLKMKALECSQDFSHYKSIGIFPDAQGQLTSQSLVRSGRI